MQLPAITINGNSQNGLVEIGFIQSFILDHYIFFAWAWWSLFGMTIVLVTYIGLYIWQK